MIISKIVKISSITNTSMILEAVLKRVVIKEMHGKYIERIFWDKVSGQRARLKEKEYLNVE